MAVLKTALWMDRDSVTARVIMDTSPLVVFVHQSMYARQITVGVARTVFQMVLDWLIVLVVRDTIHQVLFVQQLIIAK